VSEITSLITAQRAYEMNSKVITAADEMMSKPPSWEADERTFLFAWRCCCAGRFSPWPAYASCSKPRYRRGETIAQTDLAYKTVSDT